MYKRISRGHNNYKRIEQYKDYEITPCLAFEMAIRNKDFNEVIGGIYDFYTENKKLINYIIIPSEKKVSEDDNKKAAGLYLEFLHMMRRRGLSPEYMDDSYSKHAIVLNFFKIAERLGYTVPTLEPDPPPYALYNEDLIYKREKREGFTLISKSSSTILNRENKFGKVIIENEFSCPKLYPDIGHNRLVLVPINFSLPQLELNNYLTHLKKVIDRDANIIASPIELLGKKIEKANNLTALCANDTEKECFDKNYGKMFKKKLANMLYIYDCKKEEMTKEKIIININYYAEENNDKSKEYPTTSPNNYDKFLIIAQEYIDKSLYTELISGIKRNKNQIF